MEFDQLVKILTLFVIPGLAGLLAFLDGTRYRSQTKGAMELMIMASTSLSADYKRQTEKVSALETDITRLQAELYACKADCQTEIFRLQSIVKRFQDSATWNGAQAT